MGIKWLSILLTTSLVSLGCGDGSDPVGSGHDDDFVGQTSNVSGIGPENNGATTDAIVALFGPACGTCHGVTYPTLDTIDRWPGMESHQSAMPIIYAGDHTNSYLYYKLLGTHSEAPANGTGLIMPMGGTSFGAEQLTLVADWIDGL